SHSDGLCFFQKLNEAKMEAIERSRRKAGLLGANCVCAVRIENSQLSRAEMSVSAYGTAAIAIFKTVMRG
ncbi:MAG: heavy metal-binding domain-containing protein, partial [Gammaproteobacteria bacterium]|nr:heavy metal-binding domain-containing protein [Gammaproteobacteria bacterium]